MEVSDDDVWMVNDARRDWSADLLGCSTRGYGNGFSTNPGT
jgi:hypothetical protein